MVVPTILITGFLGSGKTTLINQLLTDHPDKKISLILNEFGDIKLESKFVEVKGLGMVSELSGGCLCCVANVDLPRVIRYTLEQAPQTEYLVIEASGLSDPDPVRATLTSPGLASLISLNTVLAVVDADNFVNVVTDHPLVLSQIAEADYALISKNTNHPKKEVDDLVRRVSSIGLGTKTFVWDASFDTSIIFDPPLAPHQHDETEHHHAHTAYDQYYYLSKDKHDISLIQRVLSSLPNNILRVKGYCGTHLLQKVGHHIDIRQSTGNNDKYHTAILVIGTSIDKVNLNQQFATCQV